MPVIIDTSNLNGFCRDVARYTPGVRFWDAMIHEVGKVLEGCVRLTLKDKWKVTRSVEAKNRTLPGAGGYQKGVPTIYVTKKGIIWFADYPGAGYEGIAGYKKEGLTKQRGMVDGKTFHPMNEHFRYGNPRWTRYQQFLLDLKNKQIEVRMVLGRAAQSWVQIAEALGVRIDVPGYVSNATPFKGRSHVNGFSSKIRSMNGFMLELKNTNPVLLGTIDGSHILRTSIVGREKYFKHGITEGYIADVKATAARYKGLITA